jgi:hypothetical protein
MTLRPAILEGKVLAFDEACLPQAVAKSAQAVGNDVGRLAVDKPDYRHCGLLRARCQRPRRRRAAQKG